MIEKAYAKINLGLDILGQRTDGYHEVKMVMQSIGLADEVEFTPAPQLVVTTDCPTLAGGQENLAWRAAQLLAAHCDQKPQVHIHLRKKIFVAAGLAGGSADAAAVLRGLNRLWQLGLTPAELRLLAAELGSDVPFCIEGGTALATGRGEIVEPLPELEPLWLVLAKPPVAVATAWAYQNYKPSAPQTRPHLTELEQALRAGRQKDVIACLGNVLESVTIPAHPVIATIKNLMISNGASFSMMSGSGPTVFGLVPQEAIGIRVLQALNSHLTVDTAVTKTIKRSEQK
ncbi:MAG: 4-(cytidine 5'-diphospho)-2-C-methyl-D-erythritol kinase [Acidaminococcaceae bacterium]